MTIPPSTHDHFATLLDAASSDAKWKAQWDDRTARRLLVVPSIMALFHQLRDGTISLPAFKETFDTKSRTEWDVFGMKGMSGAMFLNKLVLYVPDQTALRRELLATLPCPAPEEKGRARMAAFLGFLDSVIRNEHVPKVKIMPGRVPYFLSVWWHMQNRDFWPVYYESGRWCLNETGLFAESGDTIRDYFTYRECWLALSESLHVDTWTLESALMRAHSSRERSVPAQPAPIPSPRTPVDSSADNIQAASTIGEAVAPSSTDEAEAAPRHAEVQTILAQIGKKLGLKVWIASNDHGRSWEGRRLGELSIPALPNLGIGEDAQNIVKLIDVLWLRGNNQLVSAFEIECSTSIYSGLLRMSDLSSTCPNLSFPCYIALPAEREQEVIRQLSRPTFQGLDLHHRCGYFTVEDLKWELNHILKWSKDADCIRELAKWVEDVR